MIFKNVRINLTFSMYASTSVELFLKMISISKTENLEKHPGLKISFSKFFPFPSPFLKY